MKTLLVLSVVCTLVVLSVSGTAEQKLKNCNEVRAAYSSKGFNVNDVPNKGVNGELGFFFFFSPLSLLFRVKVCFNPQRAAARKVGSDREPPRGGCGGFTVVLKLLFKLTKLAREKSVKYARF